jgi:hypothetical protein
MSRSRKIPLTTNENVLDSTHIIHLDREHKIYILINFILLEITEKFMIRLSHNVSFLSSIQKYQDIFQLSSKVKLYTSSVFFVYIL